MQTPVFVCDLVLTVSTETSWLRSCRFTFLALLDYFNPLTPENILEESLSNFELKTKNAHLCARWSQWVKKLIKLSRKNIFKKA